MILVKTLDMGALYAESCTQGKPSCVNYLEKEPVPSWFAFDAASFRSGNLLRHFPAPQN